MNDELTIQLNESFEISLSSDGSLGIAMQWINLGEFSMGSPADEPYRDQYYSNLPVKRSFTKGFWIGKYPVTNSVWNHIVPTAPGLRSGSEADHPVVEVNWFEAVAFCELLNSRFLNQLPHGYAFSLPTNAQWEYCCRAGTTGAFYTGNTRDMLNRIAWHEGNSQGKLQPVGTKEPNRWDLCDMIGNAAEWCFDEAVTPMAGPRQDWTDDYSFFAPFRSIRNGSFACRPEEGQLNCSFQMEGVARFRYPDVSFRLSLRHVVDIVD